MAWECFWLVAFFFCLAGVMGLGLRVNHFPCTGQTPRGKAERIAFRAHAAALVLFSCLFLARPGAVLANPNVPVNVDYVYGFGDPQPQRWMNQNLYVAVYRS